MKRVEDAVDDESVILPYLVCLFNAMTRRPELRQYFVCSQMPSGEVLPGRKALKTIFTDLSDSTEDSDDAVQEWMTRLIILLMANLNGDHDASSDELDDTHQSLFLDLAN